MGIRPEIRKQTRGKPTTNGRVTRWTETAAPLDFRFWRSNYPLRSAQAFTLIELILVMAILTMAVSVTAPTLSHFFRGRSLDSEARRLLALTRAGQSRAATEGVPMDLWVDTNQKTFGLEAEPSFEDKDSKAVSYPLDSSLQLGV